MMMPMVANPARTPCTSSLLQAVVDTECQAGDDQGERGLQLPAMDASNPAGFSRSVMSLTLMPDLPLTAYQADNAVAILTIAQSQVSGVTSANSIRTEVSGVCLTILKISPICPLRRP
jgi:hypothetical protein